MSRRKRKKSSGTPGPVPYMPTQEEIAAACAEIQAGWPLAETRKRETGPGLIPADTQIVRYKGTALHGAQSPGEDES